MADRAEKFDPLAHLEQALAGQPRRRRRSPSSTPENPQYTCAARRARRSTASMAANGGWPAVPATCKLKPGQTQPARPRSRAARGDGDYTRRLPTDARARPTARSCRRRSSASSAATASSRRRRSSAARSSREMNVPDRAAHPPDRAEPRTLALAAARPRRAPHPGQHPRVPARSLGQAARSRVDARRRRQEGHADADLRRRDDPRRLQPVLERAARHRPRTRRCPRSLKDPGLPARAPTWKCSTRAASRSIRRRSTWTTPTQLPVPPAARRGELARAREVHVPEPVQRLPARHAGRLAVRARDAARSATAACALEQPLALARVRPARSARVDDGANRGGDARRRGTHRQADGGRFRSIWATGPRACRADGVLQFRNDVYGIDGAADGAARRPAVTAAQDAAAAAAGQHDPAARAAATGSSTD